jgi:hypothetical protein
MAEAEEGGECVRRACVARVVVVCLVESSDGNPAYLLMPTAYPYPKTRRFEASNGQRTGTSKVFSCYESWKTLDSDTIGFVWTRFYRY